MTTTSRNVRAGLFLFVAIAVLVAVVLVLGRQQSLFSRKLRLNTSFADISGLVVGTPVRLAGVDVGIVEDVAFDRDPDVKTVHVVLGVESRFMSRIRADSVASLGSKGLLGDMVVNVTVGSSGADELRKGAVLRSKEAVGLDELVTSVLHALGNIEALSSDVRVAVKSVITDQVSTDIGRIVHSAASLTAQAERGDGLVHALLYERALADDAKAFVVSARSVGRTADRAAKDLAAVTTAMRSGDGLVHTLVFDQDRSHLVENLAVLSSSLRTVGDDLEHGRGTVGALLKDPTVYTDLKIILGNVKRSRLLRSLVRFTIGADDLQAPVPPR